MKSFLEFKQQIDEEVLDEVLSKDAPASEWIDDFVKSDDPKFAGKSKEKRKEMALAAYYAKQRNEEVDLDEEGLKDACWKGYEAIGTKKKNGKEVPNCVPVKESDAEWEKSMEKQKHDRINDKDKDTLGKLAALMAKEKKNKPIKEAVEMTHAQIMKKIKDGTHEATTDIKPGKHVELRHNATGKTKMVMVKHNPIKEAKDEREYGYEGDMAISQLKTICRHAEHLMGMLKPDTDLPEWVQSKITLATDYMQTAHDYLMSELDEEVELEQTVFESKHYDQGSFAALKGKAYSDNPHPKGSKEHLDWAKGHNATRAMKEETLDEDYQYRVHRKGGSGSSDWTSHKDDIYNSLDMAKKVVSNMKKGATAGTQHKITRVARTKLAGPKGHLPESVLDELSKDTLGSYIKKSFAQGNELHQDLSYMRGNKATDAERKAVRDKISKRNLGIIKVNKKLKEENEMISYSEFMAKLDESNASERAAEILAAKRAERLDKYDFSKEKQKPASAVKQVKGRSYGADQPDNEDDEDENKKSSEPAVKRGRGRPTGSKSGARV